MVFVDIVFAIVYASGAAQAASLWMVVKGLWVRVCMLENSI
jgi:hypothetical protein